MSPQGIPPAAIILGDRAQDLIYPEKVLLQLNEVAQIILSGTPQEIFSNLIHENTLSQVEILFSGWGAPRLDDETLAKLPNLKAVFYGAGSIRGMVTPEFWAREIPIVSAWAMNAIPVAQMTLAMILLGLKQALPSARMTSERRSHARVQVPTGIFGGCVGLLSLGQIGQRVAEYLKPFEVEVLAYDPFCPPQKAKSLGVTLVGLEEVFQQGDVVSVHTPWLPETEGLVSAELLRQLRPGASFINTSRGAVVDEPALVEFLQSRPDVQAFLDVTWPEPAPPESPLYTLPNVLLTPHIAGSIDRECARMGLEMVAEARRWFAGESLQWQVTEAMAKRMA